MTTRTVYRVEHKDGGHGPYLKPESDEWDEERWFTVHDEVEGLHSAHERSKAHPGPRQDGLEYDRTEDHVHGFDSRKLLDKWFKGFKRKLHAAGYVVRVYEAPEDSWYPGDSGRQCIFRKDLSGVVDTQNIIAYRS